MDFLVLSAVKAAIITFVVLTAVAYLQWAERKLIAHIQRRMGPYRVGPHGLLQPLADVIKLITKEDVLPAPADRVVYVLAPFLSVTLAVAGLGVIPFGPEINLFGVQTPLQIADVDFALLYLLALSSLGVYGVALAGWASNSKYSLLGGLRSSAQMISYELPMAVTLASPLLLLNTLSLREMVELQSGYYLGFIPKWTIFQLPAPQLLAFIFFLIAAFAETNRLPFDLPEAESELVAGFHTEYSAMKFAAFFMAEYTNILVACCVATTLFLGGWHPPLPREFGMDYAPTLLLFAAGAVALWKGFQSIRWRDRITFPLVAAVFFLLAIVFQLPVVRDILVPLFWFAAKAGFLVFVFIWVRGTLPRFRYDQLMRFCWKFLFPVSVAHLMVTGLLVALYGS